jgi:hypothetical protein
MAFERGAGLTEPRATFTQLYVTYIVLYAVLSAVLGNWVDDYLASGHTGRQALIYVGGVQFSVICVVIFVSTFIPRGSLSLNPKLIEDQIKEVQKSVDEEAAVKGDAKAVHSESVESAHAEPLPEKGDL